MQSGLRVEEIPAGLKWSKTAAKKAKSDKNFIHVTLDKDGKTSDRKITGAEKLWGSNDENKRETAYIAGDYRISGTPAAIAAAFDHTDMSEDEKQEAYSSAITRDNYQGSHAGIYQKEYDDAKKENASVGSYFSEREWEAVKQALKNKQYEISVQKGKGKNKTTSTKKPRSPKASTKKAKAPVDAAKKIRDRLRDLPQGKVLDVSVMNTEGSKTKYADKPKTCRSAKFGVFSMLPIMSNNIENYILALRLAEGDDFVNQNQRNIGLVREAIQTKGIYPSGECRLVDGLSVEPNFSPSRARPIQSPRASVSPRTSQSPRASVSPRTSQSPRASVSPRASQSQSPRVASSFGSATRPFGSNSGSLPGANLAAPVTFGGVPAVRSPNRGVQTMGGNGGQNIPRFGQQ